jgi:hypothetical protein
VSDLGPILFNTLYIIFALAFFLNVLSGSQPNSHKAYFSITYIFPGDDAATEWYEEPITIVGFVAGFLLLMLVIASVLILCYSKEEDDEDTEEHSATSRDNHGLEGTTYEHDKTNPLYVSANQFDLRPFPTPLRAKFVHIHIDEPRGTREGFESYYNTARRTSEA